MSDQLDMFGEHALARHTDPVTSHAAAASLTEDMLSRLQQIVVETLRVAPNGLTVPEIAMRNDIPRDTISPRMPLLVKNRFVVDSGVKRVPPGHTRACIVWALPPKEH